MIASAPLVARIIHYQCEQFLAGLTAFKPDDMYSWRAKRLCVRTMLDLEKIYGEDIKRRTPEEYFQ